MGIVGTAFTVGALFRLVHDVERWVERRRDERGSGTMIERFLFISIAATLAVSHAGAAQCTVYQNDVDVGIPLASRRSTPHTSYGMASASSLPINAADCGAIPNRTVDQTPAIQAAINTSCGAATNKGSPPPV